MAKCGSENDCIYCDGLGECFYQSECEYKYPNEKCQAPPNKAQNWVISRFLKKV